MTNLAPHVVSVAVAVGVSAVMFSLWPREAPGTSTTSATHDAVESLTREHKALGEAVQQLTERVRQLADATERRPVHVDVPVAAAMQATERGNARNPGEAVEAVAADAATELSVEATFEALSKPGLSDAAVSAHWSRMKAAGRMDELLARFERFAKENPTNADAQAQYGIALLQRLFHSNPGPEQATYGMKADRAFLEALKVNPEHYDARMARATSLSFWPDITGKKPEAIREFETLIAQQDRKGWHPPEHVQAYIFLGNLYEQTGKADEARKLRERGAQLYPDNAELRERLRQR